jgi:hypothetical protein
VPKREFEDALTASFPRVDPDKTGVFKPPPAVSGAGGTSRPLADTSFKPPPTIKPSPATGKPLESIEDDRTSVYRAVVRDED